jgi:hypothetical protein
MSLSGHSPEGRTMLAHATIVAAEATDLYLTVCWF